MDQHVKSMTYVGGHPDSGIVIRNEQTEKCKLYQNVSLDLQCS